MAYFISNKYKVFFIFNHSVTFHVMLSYCPPWFSGFGLSSSLSELHYLKSKIA